MNYKLDGCELFCSLFSLSGDVLDQDALVDALKQKTIRGAALDVTSPEPLPHDHPLLRMPNVIVTCHTAGCTQDMYLAYFQVCIDNIKAAITGQPIPNEVTLADV